MTVCIGGAVRSLLRDSLCAVTDQRHNLRTPGLLRKSHCCVYFESHTSATVRSLLRLAALTSGLQTLC